MVGGARQLGDSPSIRDARVQLSQGARDVRIGEARQQPLLASCGFCGPDTQRLDEKDLDEALEDQFTTGTT